MPEISDPLTWAEICERYPDQYVRLVEIEPPTGLEFRTARVVGHSKTRREAFDQARPWRDHYYEMGLRFTGRTTAPLIRPPIIFDDGTCYFPPTIILDDEARDDLRVDAPGDDRTMDSALPMSGISDRFTWAEICERYPDQHVCLVEIERIHPNGPEYRSARVIGHSRTRREAFDQVRPWRDHYYEIGVRFTGRTTAPLIRPTFILDDEI